MKRSPQRKEFIPPRAPEMMDLIKILAYMALVLGGILYLRTL